MNSKGEINSTVQDAHFLAHAIRLGARGLGRTAPNPSVGCVLVKNNQVIAFARTADGGRPHAEAAALAAAGTAACGATAYVSLEPCAHHGVTPPCAEALIRAGVARVVIGAGDHDPRVAGKGIEMLQAAGIVVVVHGMADGNALRGFFRRVRHGLPYVAMKLAPSADDFLADATGAQRWLTGELARAHGHRLRSQMDAVVTGIGTVLADDPMLNVRLPGMAHSASVRVVCDRRMRLPLTSKLVKTAQLQPVWVLTTAQGVEEAASHATELREAGVVLHVLDDANFAPLTILKTLGVNGLTRVLIEAGAQLSDAFLAAECVDSLICYRAPMTLGNAGAAHVSQLKAASTPAALQSAHALGNDRIEQYELRSCLPD